MQRHCGFVKFTAEFERGPFPLPQLKGQTVMQKITVSTMFAALVGLTGCDEINSDLERAAVGAAIGCVAGEVLVDGKCVEGAVVGGAAGALSNDF